MVAGKNTTSHLAKAAAAPKLPPLPKLRVRKPDQTSANPCLGVMSSVLGMWPLKRKIALNCAPDTVENASHTPREQTADFNAGCWASSGQAAAGCANLENALRACMDQRVRNQESEPARDRNVRFADFPCYTETHRPQQEQDQPAPLPPLSPDRRTAEEEVEEDGLLDLILAYTHSEDLGMAFGVYKKAMSR